MDYHINNKGFTLVELAIVMIIIGLLIGGVLKGQELINNARVSSVISAVNGFKASHYTFKDTYGGIAGDIANAETRISGCGGSGSASECINGNGNAIVGTQSSTQSWGWWTDPDVGESIQYWKHLALADLITGVNPSADPAVPTWGETNPSSAFGGGFSMHYYNVTGGGGTDTMYGHGLRMARSTGVVDWADGSQGSHLLNPNQAANIDRKLDDGMSDTGWVQGESQSSDCDDLATANGRNYDESLESKNCTLIFIID